MEYYYAYVSDVFSTILNCMCYVKLDQCTQVCYSLLQSIQVKLDQCTQGRPITYYYFKLGYICTYSSICYTTTQCMDMIRPMFTQGCYYDLGALLSCITNYLRIYNYLKFYYFKLNVKLNTHRVVTWCLMWCPAYI